MNNVAGFTAMPALAARRPLGSSTATVAIEPRLTGSAATKAAIPPGSPLRMGASR